MKKFNVAYKGRKFVVKAKDEKSAMKGVVRKLKDSEWKPLGEIAQEIRQAIKEKWGLNNRQCYVRGSSFSGGRAVDIILGADVPMDTYREIQRWARGGYEEIARDEFGEILSGGNTYIMVMKKDENGSNTMYGMDKKSVKDADKYHNSDLYKIYKALDNEGLHFVVDNNEFEFDSREEALKGWAIIKKCLEGTEHDCDFWSPFYVKVNIDENFITDRNKVNKDRKTIKDYDWKGWGIDEIIEQLNETDYIVKTDYGDIVVWTTMYNRPIGYLDKNNEHHDRRFNSVEEAREYYKKYFQDSKKIKDLKYDDYGNIVISTGDQEKAKMWWDEVESLNYDLGHPANISNSNEYDRPDYFSELVSAIFDMLLELKEWYKKYPEYQSEIKDLFSRGKSLYNKYAEYSYFNGGIKDKKSVKDEKPNLLGNYNWEWDEVVNDWYDTISKNYYLDIVKNSTLPNPAFLDKKTVKDFGGLYTNYDGWTQEDIELHKNTNWGARDYRELPVESDSFNYNVKLYSMDGSKEDNARFIKYIRPNPIFPPYYAPAPEYSYSGYLGPMFDGETHGAYDIHNRYETQDLYNLLSDSKPKKLRNKDKKSVKDDEFAHKSELETTVKQLIKEGKDKEYIKNYCKSFPTVAYTEEMDKFIDMLCDKKSVKDSDTLDFKGIVERIDAFKKKNPNIDKISPYKAMAGLNEYTKFSYALYLAYEQLKGVPYFDRVQQAYYRAMNDKRTKYSRYLGGK